MLCNYKYYTNVMNDKCNKSNLTFSNSSYSTSPSPLRSNILKAISNIRGGAVTKKFRTDVHLSHWFYLISKHEEIHSIKQKIRYTYWIKVPKETYNPRRKSNHSDQACKRCYLPPVHTPVCPSESKGQQTEMGEILTTANFPSLRRTFPRFSKLIRLAMDAKNGRMHTHTKNFKTPQFNS